jgi:hypothetical protein
VELKTIVGSCTYAFVITGAGLATCGVLAWFVVSAPTPWFLWAPLGAFALAVLSFGVRRLTNPPVLQLDKEGFRSFRRRSPTPAPLRLVRHRSILRPERRWLRFHRGVQAPAGTGSATRPTALSSGRLDSLGPGTGVLGHTVVCLISRFANLPIDPTALSAANAARAAADAAQ